jgi:hypothetical protein
MKKGIIYSALSIVLSFFIYGNSFAQVTLDPAQGLRMGTDDTTGIKPNGIRINKNDNVFDVSVNDLGQLQFFNSATGTATVTFDDDNHRGIGIGTDDPKAKLHIVNGTPLSNLSGGYIINGNKNSTHLGIDFNSLQVWSNQTPTGFYLNYYTRSGTILASGGGNRTNFTFHHDSGSPQANGSGFTLENNETNNNRWNFYVVNADGNLQLYQNENLRGQFDDASGAYTALSDKRLKNNIQAFDFDLKLLDRLQPKTYHFKTDASQQEYIGFIAQEVDKVFPQLVSKSHVGDTDEEVQLLDYSGFGVIAIAAIKQLKKEVDTEKAEKEKLQEQLNAQQVQIDELKTLVNQLIKEKQKDNETDGQSYNLSLNQKAKLAQNQPNPFHQKTMVEYFIPENIKNAEMRVTALDGRLLGRVKITGKGKGQVNIEANTYPAGTYHYSLVLDGKIVETKRMVLTR